jgi:monoterpene epsilon-lactone hydrolase
MPQNLPERPDWLVVHPVTPEDAVAAAALRSMTAPMKGRLAGTAGREPFDGIMEGVAPASGVVFEAATVGGISGWWAKPEQSFEDAAILHVHGGWFNWGTAKAYRNFAGHIASCAETDVFIPDYRLAPEHPFPAAIHDLETCYRGLVASGFTKIGLSGDSAGGNLALVLLSIASPQAAGALLFSPISDLALRGESFETRAEADPYFTKAQAAGLVRSYLGKTDPENPLASPLYGDLRGLPPVRIQVGDDEVLLDDSLRYVERAVSDGVDARVDLWMGMPHGFVINIDGFSVAQHALKEGGAFLAEQLRKARLPSREEIAQRAYQLWEERGRPHGSDEEDWHRAEHELRRRSAAPVTQNRPDSLESRVLA